jgi:hypothetical protein
VRIDAGFIQDCLSENGFKPIEVSKRHLSKGEFIVLLFQETVYLFHVIQILVLINKLLLIIEQ